MAVENSYSRLLNTLGGVAAVAAALVYVGIPAARVEALLVGGQERAVGRIACPASVG